MGKSTINGPFSIAMLVYQRVTMVCGRYTVTIVDGGYFMVYKPTYK